MILNSPFISGSLTVTGNTILSGSITSLAGIAGTASYATNAEMLDGLDSTSFLNTSSFNTVSSSFSTRVTAAEATASAFVTASGSLAARLVSNEAKTGSYATTGSNVFSGSQTISGSLTATGTITAQTLVVQTITSSVDFVTGSARFGTLSSNTHEFTGSVSISGSIITGTSADYVVLNNGNLYRTSGSGYGTVNITGRNVSLQYDNLSTGAVTGLLLQSGSGNVGIGSSAPGVRLDVAGILNTTVTSSVYNAAFYNKTTDALAAITIQATDTSTSGVNSGSAAIELVGRADNSAHGRHAWMGAEGVIGQTYRTRVKFKIRGESNTGYTWANPNAEAPTIMTLDGNGYVGIGSSAPTNALDVVGTMKLTNNAGSVSIALNKNNSTVGASSQLYFQDQGTTKWDLGAFNIGAAGANDFSLYNRSGSGSNPVTVLYANNNVGIGTTNPIVKLHVADSGGGRIVLDATSGSGVKWQMNSWTDGKLYIGVYNVADYLTLTSAGNVGIGTASPGAILDTYINGTYSSGTNIRSYRVQDNNSTTGKAIDVYITNSGSPDNVTMYGMYVDAFVGNGNNNKAYSIYTNRGNAIFGATSGNVGIGTTNPGYNLDIQGTESKIQIKSTGAGGGTWVMASTYNDWSAGGGKYVITTNGGSAGIKFAIDSSGNVGIGTYSPTKLLEVNGRMYTTAIVSGNILAGNISSNIASSPSFILICDLNNSAGFSMSGKINAASYTCWNISDIWIKKDYSSTNAAAGITGAYKSGCDFSIVDCSYSGGRYIALRFTGNPEIDVMCTGYRLNALFAASGEATVVTGATVNSTLASY